MKEQHITIQEYANHFGLMWLSGDREAMKRPIYEPTVNRPGLELACFFDYPRSKRLVFLGNKETAFIKTMSEENINLAFDFLMNDKCPGIVVCNNLEVDEEGCWHEDEYAQICYYNKTDEDCENSLYKKYWKLIATSEPLKFGSQ